jgi:hypothetical protein
MHLSSFFSPNFYFIYIKNPFTRSKLIPDNEHAFFTNNLDSILKELNEASVMIKKKKKLILMFLLKALQKKFSIKYH